MAQLGDRYSMRFSDRNRVVAPAEEPEAIAIILSRNTTLVMNAKVTADA
jgi:hypothetical protein